MTDVFSYSWFLEDYIAHCHSIKLLNELDTYILRQMRFVRALKMKAMSLKTSKHPVPSLYLRVSMLLYVE